MPSFPDLPGRLSDGVVALRLASEWDIPDILIAHQDDPELYRRLGMTRPPSGAELGRRAEHEPAQREAGVEMRLTVVEPGDNTCRGQLEVHQVNWRERCAELGMWLAPQVRGQGWAPRVLRLAAGWLFDGTRLERLELLTDPDNAAMLAAARAAGFAGGRQEQDLVSLTLLRPPPGSPTASGA